MKSAHEEACPPPLPRACFVVGITGHRSSHPSFPDDPSALDKSLERIFDQIDQAVETSRGSADDVCNCTTRLLTLLADGTDHHAARHALGRDWELVIPLPFGKALNAAINASPATPADIRAILAGKPVAEPQVASRIEAISSLARRARLFELGDEDERITALFLAAADRPDDRDAVSHFAAEAGQRSALAGRILIEQSDLVIAVWDGKSTANVGGTGHTAAVALELGSPVLWIDPDDPENWQILLSPEALTGARIHIDHDQDMTTLAHIVEQAVALAAPENDGQFAGLSAIGAPSWQDRSNMGSHAFRRLETLFGEERLAARFKSVRQDYEHPSKIAQGSGRELLHSIETLAGGDPHLAGAVSAKILERFAWIDGISAHLSDRYRSGMVVNFLLGSFAIISGILYLPLVDTGQKWIFAAIELLLLLTIIANTIRGQKVRLHGRWFETRRAAEYLRHSPIVVALGVARSPGSWPQGTKSWWPEWYVRHVLRGIGLPVMRIDKPYLRSLLIALRDHHVDPQLRYHRDKSERLTRVHHGIDHLSEILFVAAVCFVALYLALAAAANLGLVDQEWLKGSAKWFTLLAVALPTLGGAFAGIRYFGDFERFAEISEITAEKLDVVAARIALMLSAPDEALNYNHASDIVHATDEIVFSEIQNWQAVFSGKRTAVPA